MTCPHCGFKPKLLVANGKVDTSSVAPYLCESCIAISLLERGNLRKCTEAELQAIHASPAYEHVIAPVRRDLLERKQRATATGNPPAVDCLDTSAPQPIDPRTGQHKDHWVLSDEERASGFLRPLRDCYVHKKCKTVTSMGRKIAETYARDPKYYGATFCCLCRGYFPVKEFVWEDGTEVGS